MTLMNVNNRPAYRSFDGLVNDLFGNFNNVATRQSNISVVPVNILENEEGFHLEFAAPGRQKENFKIKLEGTQLAVSYEGKKEDKEKNELKTVRSEFSVSSFNRNFTLNNKVNAEAIQAKYEDGLLKVFIPKKEEAKPLTKDITIA